MHSSRDFCILLLLVPLPAGDGVAGPAAAREGVKIECLGLPGGLPHLDGFKHLHLVQSAI